MEKNNNIENIFKNSFEDYRVIPESQTWTNISKALSAGKFTEFSFRPFNIYYLVAIFVAMIGLVYLFSDLNKQYTATELTSIKKMNPSKINKDASISLDSLNDNETKMLINEPTLANNQKRNKKRRNKTGNSGKIEAVTPLPDYNISSFSVEQTNNDNNLEHLNTKSPEPFFELNTHMGCVPLTVKVKNNSKYALKYDWSFGNESFSTKTNPTYTFKEAGVYTIRLKATGAGGVSCYFIDSVVVYDKLIGETKLSFNNKVTENKYFTASVESNNATDYKWYFGDGCTSQKQKATHSYKKEGTYTISLVGKNNNNCYDSTTIKRVIVAKSPYKIIYPTAFCPNLSGASSGRYSANNRNEIFHPLVVGTLSEYHIKIYAKTGVVIFETKDINIGWNGYYKNKLMPEGVYPYIVSLKFEGEEEAIQKKGNITILHREHR